MEPPDDPRARWNRKHADAVGSGTAPTDPSSFLTANDALLPTSGRAVDVAGGTGRHALWLAARGLDVTLVDVSDTACAEATRRAIDTGVSLDVVRADLSRDPLPAGPWDVIVVTHWLDRDVWSRLPAELAPSGTLLLCQATVSNLERHDRPPRHFLLEDGEVAQLADRFTAADAALEVIALEEGWTDEDRHEARLVLRRAAG